MRQVKLTEAEAQLLRSLMKMGITVRTIDEIVEISGQGKDTVNAIVRLLEQRGVVKLSERLKIIVELTEEGRRYAGKKLLPELYLLKMLESRGGRASLIEVRKALGAALANIALNWCLKKKYVRIVMEGSVRIVEQTRPAGVEDPDLLFLTWLFKNGAVELDMVPEKYKGRIDVLKRRKLIVFRRVKEVIVEPTDLMREIADGKVEVIEEVGALTSKHIETGSWRRIVLREYDVKARPPPAYPGRRHFYTLFLDEVRRIMLEMGFEEAMGPFVELAFWNFDVLFQAQDHPAREIHDSFLVRNLGDGILPVKDYVEKVRSVHENGWVTGSKGWRYKWNEEEAKRLMLRSQTTAVSARYLYAHREPPIRMFCISRVFRPDVLDAKHSMEFTQVEGLYGDYDTSFRELLGLLKELAERLGFKEIKFKPAYFPFTEPSVEAYIYHPKLGWIEALGAGMLRKEVLAPLGIDFPVGAWGIGIDRIAMAILGVDDIRNLYTSNLDFIRKISLRWLLCLP